jgi:SsrA-binding protein
VIVLPQPAVLAGGPGGVTFHFRSMAEEDIINNRKVLREYHILERFEAGIALRGTEVKSIRSGRANLNDAFARIEKGQAWLYNADIQPYERASHNIQHDAKRTRRLLLHRQEIDKLHGFSSIKGHALVALRMYWKKGHVKIEIGVGKGKVASDKRADLKERVTRRETEREVARFNRRHG